MRVRLERAENPGEGVGGAAAAGPSAEAPRHQSVLYIEDNLSNLNLVERLLSRLPGVRLIPAMKGGLGLELARRHLPSLILLDLHLPDLNGREVLRRLKDDAATAEIPVVVLSADATESQVEMLRAEGAAEYLSKPIDVESLYKIVSERRSGIP